MAKATASELGWNPITRRLVVLQVLVAAVTGILVVGLNLSISGWFAEAPIAIVAAIVAGLLLYFVLVPGRSGSGECYIAEALVAFVLLSTCSCICVVAQYPAVALGLPYADHWLARTDAVLGINVAELGQWTGRHPIISRVLIACYDTFAFQFPLTIAALAAFRDRRRLWEFVFHYHVAIVITVIAFAVWPALCAPAYYGFTSVIDMTRLMGQIRGFHDRTMTGIPLDQLEGLVSVPSFHVAGALIVMWAWRDRLNVLVPLAALNVLLIAATFVTGIHYFTDVVAGMFLFICSVVVYRRDAMSVLASVVAETAGPTVSDRQREGERTAA